MIKSNKATSFCNQRRIRITVWYENLGEMRAYDLFLFANHLFTTQGDLHIASEPIEDSLPFVMSSASYSIRDQGFRLPWTVFIQTSGQLRTNWIYCIRIHLDSACYLLGLIVFFFSFTFFTLFFPFSVDWISFLSAKNICRIWSSWAL